MEAVEARPAAVEVLEECQQALLTQKNSGLEVEAGLEVAKERQAKECQAVAKECQAVEAGLE